MLPYMSGHKRDKFYSNFGNNSKPRHILESLKARTSPQRSDRVSWQQPADEAHQAPGDTHSAAADARKLVALAFDDIETVADEPMRAGPKNPRLPLSRPPHR
jgi:hypothetical protein